MIPDEGISVAVDSDSRGEPAAEAATRCAAQLLQHMDLGWDRRGVSSRD